MICDERGIEDVSIRLSNTINFTERNKRNLKKSTTDWCKDCNTGYKSECTKVSYTARKYKLGNPTDKYLDDVESLKNMCKSLSNVIRDLPTNVNDMNRDTLELVKEDLLKKSKDITEVLEVCLIGREKFTNNCIFNRWNNKPGTDFSHSNNINNLKIGFNECKSVLDLTTDKQKWEDKMKYIYGKEYPSDSVYHKPISPARSRKKKSHKKSSRGSKRTIKKKGKRRGIPITSKRKPRK